MGTTIYKTQNPLQLMKFPLEVFFSFTTKCNLKCKHCYSNSISGGKTIDLDRLMESLVRIKPLRIIISGGDPLVEFDKLLGFLKDYKEKYKLDSYIVLATNATLFTKTKLEALKPYVDRIQVSLDTLSRNRFLEIRGVDLLDKTVEGIILARNLGFDIQIAFSIFRENIEEIPQIIEFCSKNKIPRINVLRQRPLGRSKSNVGPTQIKEVYQKFLSLSEGTGIKIIIHDPIANALGIKSECTAAKESLAIDIEGNFKPCPLFAEGVKGDFDEVWNNNLFFKDVRKIPVECKGCSITSCRGGCKACSWNVFHKLKKDPWCLKC